MKYIVLLFFSGLLISCSSGGGNSNPSSQNIGYKCDYINEGNGDPQYCLERACKEVGGKMYEIAAGIKQCSCDGIFLADSTPTCLRLEKVETSCQTLTTESHNTRLCHVLARTGDKTYGSFLEVAPEFTPAASPISPEHNIISSYARYPFVKLDTSAKYNSGYEVRPNSDLDIYNFNQNEVKNLASLNYTRTENENLISEYNPYVHYYSTKDIHSLAKTTIGKMWLVNTKNMDASLRSYQQGIQEVIELVNLQSITKNENPLWSIHQANSRTACFDSCQLSNNISYKENRGAKQLVHLKNGYLVRSEWVLKSKDLQTVYVAVTNPHNSISYILIFRQGQPGLLVNSDLKLVSQISEHLNVKPEVL